MAGPAYNTIGDNYNQTRVADPYLAKCLYRLLQGNAHGHYLDIGSGTGNYTIAMQEMGLQFTGMDPSEKMLSEAQARNSHIPWVEGVAEKMPFANQAFDGAIATLTVHHWKDLNVAFGEISRVLKAASRLVIFTSTPEQMQGYWLNHYFPKMLADSIQQMPDLDALKTAAELAGMQFIHQEIYAIQSDLKDYFLYVGKDHPEKYFDATVRHGISSFSALSMAEEVQAGLEQLERDLTEGTFDKIQSAYRHTKGDYLFLVFSKPVLEGIS